MKADLDKKVSLLNVHAGINYNANVTVMKIFSQSAVCVSR